MFEYLNLLVIILELLCTKKGNLFYVLKNEHYGSKIKTKKSYFSNIYRKVLILEP